MKALLPLPMLLIALLLHGCGAHGGYPASASYEENQRSSIYPVTSSASTGTEAADERRFTGDTGPELSDPTPEQPLVVYQGYLKLRVRRVLEAVEAIAGLTDAAKGYIDSQSASVVIVRIPAGDFERVMSTFAGVGDVIDRQVRAIDVTEQFTDLEGRLGVARQTRERLLALLALAADVEERLKIIHEIKRLTEHIESVESTLATLENLVAYFTVTIELVPVRDEGRVVAHVSPFPWIRRLSAHEVTLHDGQDAIGIDLPRGFVRFTEDESYRAQAADMTTLRAAELPNEPAGDAAFWIAAIAHEMDGRDEELVARAGEGMLSVRTFRDKDPQPRYYQVGVATVGDRLFVVEAFYPTEEAWKAHGSEITAALATFRVVQ